MALLQATHIQANENLNVKKPHYFSSILTEFPSKIKTLNILHLTYQCHYTTLTKNKQLNGLYLEKNFKQTQRNSFIPIRMLLSLCMYGYQLNTISSTLDPLIRPTQTRLKTSSKQMQKNLLPPQFTSSEVLTLHE